MLRFVSDKSKPMKQHYDVWDYTLPEIYGIILGMFSKLGLVDCLNITNSELLDFIIDVDRGYLATFYHSFYHAADVTFVLYHILVDMNASQFLSKPDMAALLLAGLCHDIGHVSTLFGFPVLLCIHMFIHIMLFLLAVSVSRALNCLCPLGVCELYYLAGT